nr:molybdopterin-synthase adenylyltransferase MoeB [Pseudomarimonas arenosa]
MAEARRLVEEVDCQVAFDRQAQGARLIDVREAHEFAVAAPSGAQSAPRSALELGLGEYAWSPDEELLLICGSGRRSLLAGLALQRLGYSRVRSVAGGFDAWKAAGLPIEQRDLDPDWLQRYARHINLDEIGLSGQQTLQASRILVIGAGGLGCPALQYLAAAGVGHIRIADDDKVERSNLQRQVLHAEARIGMNKAESARLSLQALNPRVKVEVLTQRIDDANVDQHVAACDLVVDGSDNLPTRYRVSDACVRQGKPMVFAAVHRFQGQVAVFNAGVRRGHSPCYRCLFPAPPPAELAPNCSEVGVLGVTPGIFGLLQANEAIKLLLGIGDSLDGRLLSLDLLSLQMRLTRIPPDPDCPACGRAGTSDLQPVAEWCANSPPQG